MATPWVQTGEPASLRGTGDLVTLVDGSTFCISEDNGRIRPGHPHGLFVRDTRFLSRWQLRIDGMSVEPLTVQRAQPFASVFVGRVPPASGAADSKLLVLEHRYVGNGMRADLTIRNLGASTVRCAVSLVVGADFADLFEVKDGRAARRVDIFATTTSDGIEIIGAREGRVWKLRLVAAGSSSRSANTLAWQASVAPHRSWTVCLELRVTEDDQPLEPRHPCGSPPEHAAPARLLREWRRRGSELSTADPAMASLIAQSVEDLGALRMFDPQHPDRAVIAAGMPWFMALFGRDSLLTSWMLLPLDSGLALGTLQTLAAHQGEKLDPTSEEQPGRILHEMRFGPTATLGLGGRGVYYGSADASALFVMLLGELSRWGVAKKHIDALLPHADRALSWIERYGDLDGDGFIEYHRANQRGLANQGWKDSWDGINFSDGRMATSPIALAEVQAYTYAAYLARAELARERDDVATSHRWAAKADRLKAAFNKAFWLPKQGWFAVGLDANKMPIDSLTSNIGHCLWAGIVEKEKADKVAKLLLSPDMFSGWGIRTLAASMGAYNPMSYHNGSIWPHDNALCAAGLMRYGFVEHAQRVAIALFEAATHFGNRLPELFCGFERNEFIAPVPYPTSCIPQAWAAATPLYLLRTLLRLAPQAPASRIWCAPAVPDRYQPLTLRNVKVGEHDLVIEVRAGHTQIHGLRRAGLRLMTGAQPA